jgi:hypothetical protein
MHTPVHPPSQTPIPTNGKAIASMILGIQEIHHKGENGKGMAVAGLVCGIIGTAIYGLILLFVIIGMVTYGIYSL